jgi:hypothetical protein
MPRHVARHIFFKLSRCGYTLRVTSQTSYSPEYITPTQKQLIRTIFDNLKYDLKVFRKFNVLTSSTVRTITVWTLSVAFLKRGQTKFIDD